MEQQRKAEWDKLHFGDSNPYDELPELKIYTYDLGKILTDKSYVELEDKAFNFREFFRVWTGDIKHDHKAMPATAQVGDFVHESDVWSFLNLITKMTRTATILMPMKNTATCSAMPSGWFPASKRPRL